MIVLPAHDHIHEQKPAKRFQKDVIFADGKIAALHQRVAQVTRQKRMFEIGLVVRPGSQHHDARILALDRHHPVATHCDTSGNNSPAVTRARRGKCPA